MLTACFGNPSTLGLPCIQDSACFDGLVCRNDVCVDPSVAEATDSGDGDGDPDTGDGDGDGDGDGGDGDQGDGDGDAGDGDGDSDAGDGDGDGDTGDGDGDGEAGDGDGDGEPVEPMCGNNMVEPGENCDGTDLDRMSCADFGFGGGMLSCNDCDLNLSDCCHSDGQACVFGAGTCCDGLTCINLMFKCG
jgi:hypothetical protein